MRAIYAPLLIVVFYIFLIDEGVRWLLARNKKVEAVKILNKVAKINNVTLSNTAKKMMEKITEDINKTEKSEKIKEPEPSHLLSVLKSKKILFRLALTAACFFFSLFIYYAALINSTSISGNKYVNYSLMILVSVPVRIITAYTLTKFGRKAPICIANGLSAVFFVLSAFIPKSEYYYFSFKNLAKMPNTLTRESRGGNYSKMYKIRNNVCNIIKYSLKRSFVFLNANNLINDSFSCSCMK